MQSEIIVGAIIGAIFGSISAVFGAWFTYRLAQKKRADDLFSTALEFMGGGTQRRNLGISTLSLYWREFPQHRELCAEMLIGSAIYLLTESKQKDAEHEVFNLHRIIALLNDISADVDDRKGYIRLGKVLDIRINNYQSKPDKGLWIDKRELHKWHDHLQTTR
ncbi:MAG: hypothetical protein M9928_11265 [Anaerolineae bacterium]|nr:hypothetical protein [Anaerolineae bacterium]MCO5205605.1 hypothetical protein [Anaerolineae bacterium]